MNAPTFKYRMIDAGAGNYFPVNNIYPAVQGEGVNAGVAMVLLRMHGCGVACPFCDTKETWELDPANEQPTLSDALGANEKFVILSGSEIARDIKQAYPQFKWVMLTGGEPAKQTLLPLINALHDAGYKVAIETSGTETGHVGAGIDWVCVSPKIRMPGGKTIKPSAVAAADELKFVVGRARDLEIVDQFLSEFDALKESCQICLQPMSQNPRATQLCIETVMDRGWRLSIQTHKYLDLP